VAGALQLVRFGATLAAEPTRTARLIDACAALARAHLALPNSEPTTVGQVFSLHVAKRLFMSTLVLRHMLIVQKTEHRFEVSILSLLTAGRRGNAAQPGLLAGHSTVCSAHSGADREGASAAGRVYIPARGAGLSARQGSTAADDVSAADVSFTIIPAAAVRTYIGRCRALSTLRCFTLCAAHI
jgi:hypothetical protein